MNSKKTNYLVVVLNALLVLIFYALYCSSDFLFSKISNGGISIYNCHTAEFLLNNIEVIIFFMYSIYNWLIDSIPSIFNEFSNTLIIHFNNLILEDFKISFSSLLIFTCS